MGRNGVKVVIRTRPTANFAQNQIQIDQDENTLSINQSKVLEQEGPSNRKDSWKFKFHKVLHNSGQDTAYEAIAQDIVHSSVIEGITGTIMAYGQTGAGKSFTMIGDTNNYEHRGIAPRAIAHVYNEIANRIEVIYTIHVTYMEIYNDRIYDLLSDVAKHSATTDYAVVEDAKGTSVRGLTMIEAKTEKEALDQLFQGELQKVVAAHKLNKSSNRAHCIFTLHISQKSRSGGSEHMIHSKLHLVDLAGSERLKKTMADEVAGQEVDITMKKESMYINQSLSYLEQCVVALGSREQRHIPYRQTKLTNVLKDSLGGNCNTLMFACIWCESKHLEETISTLKLAQRMMRVQNSTSAIVETDPNLLLKKYERQIKELKQELNMHDALIERTGVVYDEFTPEQKHDLMKTVQMYIDATSREEEDRILQLSSIHQIREYFRQFKLLLLNSQNNGGMFRSSSRVGTTPSSSMNHPGHESGFENGEGEEGDSHFVGELDDNSGFSIGIAADIARPASVELIKSIPLKHTNQDEEKSQSFSGTKDNMEGSTTLAFTNSSLTEMEKDDAFKYYKNGPGKKINDNLLIQREQLKEIKKKAKLLSEQVNEKKEEIMALKTQIEEKQTLRISSANDKQKAGVEDDILDEEEFILLQEEREKKKLYRDLFEKLQDLKQDLTFSTQSVDNLKLKLVEDFEEWYKAGGNKDYNEDEKYQDKLDDGEMFDKLEMDRVFTQNPDSIAFFQAQKKMNQIAHAPNSPVRKRNQRRK